MKPADERGTNADENESLRLLYRQLSAFICVHLRFIFPPTSAGKRIPREIAGSTGVADRAAPAASPSTIVAYVAGLPADRTGTSRASHPAAPPAARRGSRPACREARRAGRCSSSG